MQDLQLKFPSLSNYISERNVPAAAFHWYKLLTETATIKNSLFLVKPMHQSTIDKTKKPVRDLLVPMSTSWLASTISVLA